MTNWLQLTGLIWFCPLIFLFCLITPLNVNVKLQLSAQFVVSHFSKYMGRAFTRTGSSWLSVTLNRSGNNQCEPQSLIVRDFPLSKKKGTFFHVVDMPSFIFFCLYTPKSYTPEASFLYPTTEEICVSRIFIFTCFFLSSV